MYLNLKIDFKNKFMLEFLARREKASTLAVNEEK